MVKRKYANRKQIHDLQFDDNNNIYPICHHFRDIRSGNVHRNLYLQNGTMSDVNMLIESTFATSYLLAVVMLPVLTTSCLLAVVMLSVLATSCLLAMVMLPVLATSCLLALVMFPVLATSCLLAVVMLPVLVTVFKDIRSRNLHDLAIDLSYGPRSDVSMPIESRYQTFYSLIVGPICYCETITYAFDSKFDLQHYADSSNTANVHVLIKKICPR